MQYQMYIIVTDEFVDVNSSRSIVWPASARDSARLRGDADVPLARRSPIYLRAPSVIIEICTLLMLLL